MKKLIIIIILLFWPINLMLNWHKRDFSSKDLTETVFVQDYQAEQRILEKINLYPSVPFARVYQNKARIYLDKITSNFFALVDLNSYFFGFHPREFFGNQNLKKFPFISIIFFLYGLYSFNTIKRKRLIIFFSLISLACLSILENFDSTDFLLWLPISLVILHGLNIIYSNKKYWKFIVVVFWIFTIPQIIRIFLGYQ